jgi:hypothetical protein
MAAHLVPASVADTMSDAATSWSEGLAAKSAGFPYRRRSEGAAPKKTNRRASACVLFIDRPSCAATHFDRRQRRLREPRFI